MLVMAVKMQAKYWVVLLVVCMTPSVFSKSRRVAKIRGDPLMKTRCDLLCMDARPETKAQCRFQCRQHQKKPGTCSPTDSPTWAAACVETCNLDSQCDGTQVCCHHSCGSSCSEPIDLLTIPGLPPVPVLEEPLEKKRSVIMRWSNGVGDAARAVPGRIFYVLEEQHHVGPKYEEARLGDWNLLSRTNKTKVSLRNLLKPGRWYRFRVAAVSAAGTRGYSLPSVSFTPRRGPRAPPPPRKLKVRPLKSDNGTLTIRLEWKAPRSDLPVMKYKVFWSRRVRGLGGADLDSVFVNHQTVTKDQNHIDIKDLQPDSLYFLQVQTITQFGLTKLRSEKAAIFYNTTSIINDQSPQALLKRERKITGLKLHKIVWYNHKLKAKISWDPFRSSSEGKPRKYFVHWETISCKNNNTHKELSAATQECSFEIYELVYHCTYKVIVNRSWKSKSEDSELIVTVPDCDYFQQKVKNGTILICNNNNKNKGA